MDLSSRDKDCLWDGINKVQSLHDLTACLAMSGLHLHHTEVPCLFMNTRIGVPEYLLSRLGCRLLAVSHRCPCRGMRSSFGLLTSVCILAPEATGPPAYPSASSWFILQRVRALGSLLRPLQFWDSGIPRNASWLRQADSLRWPMSREGLMAGTLQRALQSVDMISFMECSWCAGSMSSIRNETSFTSRPVETLDSHGEPRTLEGDVKMLFMQLHGYSCPMACTERILLGP